MSLEKSTATNPTNGSKTEGLQWNPPQFKTKYTQNQRVSIDCGGPSPTQQQFKDECDINSILAKYKKHGGTPVLPIAAGTPMFGDFFEVDDYRGTLEQIAAAEAAFAALPKEARSQFESAAAWIDAGLPTPSSKADRSPSDPRPVEGGPTQDPTDPAGTSEIPPVT